MPSSTIYQCPECSYESQWGFAIINHLRRFHQHKPQHLFECASEVEAYPCKICDNGVELRIDLHWHQKQNHATKTPSRNVNYSANGFIKFVKPIISKLDAIENQCFECELITFSKVYFFKHLESCRERVPTVTDCSNETKWFECRDCEYKGKQKAHLRQHQISKHASCMEIDWFECRDCEYKAKCKGSLKRHRISKHTPHSQIKWFQCQYCEYKAKRNNTLKKHQISKHTASTEINWFECNDCEYRAKQKITLKNHQINKHAESTEITWFQCHQCSYKTKQKSTLKDHLVNKHVPESQINWLKCPECEYKAKQKSYLRMHQIRMHTPAYEVNWFECHDCENTKPN